MITTRERDILCVLGLFETCYLLEWNTLNFPLGARGCTLDIACIELYKVIAENIMFWNMVNNR